MKKKLPLQVLQAQKEFSLLGFNFKKVYNAK